ncbi:thiol reductase thioredoxin [bacterium]|nr:thiol reductase thioredoxin [bacterium]
MHVRTESQRLRAACALLAGSKPPEENARLVEITDESFEDEVVRSRLPVVIDFWAQTCVPCKLMHPVMLRLARAFSGVAKVGRLNVHENPRTAEALEIKAIPHIIVVLNGDIVLELVGDRSFEDLRTKLAPFVTPSAYASEDVADQA